LFLIAVTEKKLDNLVLGDITILIYFRTISEVHREKTGQGLYDLMGIFGVIYTNVQFGVMWQLSNSWQKRIRITFWVLASTAGTLRSWS